MKCKVLLLIAFFGGIASAISQAKQEREFKIEENEFPKKAKGIIETYLADSKRIRFYKEIDGDKVSYEVKFKKDKLKYSIEFSEGGNLEDIEFVIKEVDIPSDSFEMITNYLEANHKKNRIKKIQQQYLNNIGNPKELLRVAFQNLILPEINYEIIVATKDDKGYAEYEITFNSEGKHILSRRLVKQKYDHVLY